MLADKEAFTTSPSAINLFSLFVPGRIQDDATEITPLEFRIMEREHIVVHRSKRSLRLVAESIVKGVNNLLLEMVAAGMRLNHRLTLGVGHAKVADAENVHLYTRSHQRYFGFLVLGNARGGVECNGVPNNLNGGLADATLLQKLPSGVGAIDFESLRGTTVLLGQTDVVKHGPDVEQLGIELQFLSQSCQCPEIIDSGRVVEEEVTLSVPHEFGGGLRQFAVRYADTCY